MRAKADVLQDVQEMLTNTDGVLAKLEYEIDTIDLIDLAGVFGDLPLDQQVLILRSLTPEKAAVVLGELEGRIQKTLAQAAPAEVLGNIVNEMYADDVADFLGEASDKQREAILHEVAKEDSAYSEEVKALMRYDPYTAGGMMTTEMLKCRMTDTADMVGDMVRRRGKDVEIIDYIYVTDKGGLLKGVVSMREVWMADPKKIVDEFATHDVISVLDNMPQEQVAQIIEKYNFDAIPVVNDTGKLLGIITIDDVIDVMHEEHEEDMFRIAGATSPLTLDSRIAARLSSRAPWLLLTILGGIGCAAVLSLFQNVIERITVLAFFFPVIMATGGATGNQSATLIVRAIAMDEFDWAHLFKTIFAEVLTGAFLGLVCGLFLAGTSFICSSLGILTGVDGTLSVVIGISMFCGVTTGGTVGILTPLICHRVGIDPALAAGPFVSMFNDVTGLLIYLNIASLLASKLT